MSDSLNFVVDDKFGLKMFNMVFLRLMLVHIVFLINATVD